MIVIVRIDLDRLFIFEIERLVRMGVITLGDATEAKSVKEMSEYDQLMWFRGMQQRVG